MADEYRLGSSMPFYRYGWVLDLVETLIDGCVDADYLGSSGSHSRSGVGDQGASEELMLSLCMVFSRLVRTSVLVLGAAEAESGE
jgi:hypothetical protein